MYNYSEAQKRRLIELGLDREELKREFEDVETRKEQFQLQEKQLVKSSIQALNQFLDNDRTPSLKAVEELLKDWLKNQKGYSEVVTPMIISNEKLRKMSIDSDNKLMDQVFKLSDKECLRPMLAPNLYIVMRDLKRSLNKSVSIFECGNCFRKESQGSQHLNEFTMLNLVNFAGVEDGNQMAYLKEISHEMMAHLGIEDYEFEISESSVYGETLDIVCDGMEIASGSFGPHPLDANWGVFDTWVGLGIGVDRLAKHLGSFNTIRQVGRSTSYLSGSRIKI